MRVFGLLSSLLAAAGLLACSDGDGGAGRIDGAALDVSARGEGSTLFTPGALTGVAIYDIDASGEAPMAQLRLSFAQQRSPSGGPAYLNVQAQQAHLRAPVGERALDAGELTMTDAMAGAGADLEPTEVELVTVALALDARWISALLRVPSAGTELAIEGPVSVTCRFSSSEPPVAFDGEAGGDAPPRCAAVFDAISGGE